MANQYKVNATGLNFRSAPVISPDNIISILSKGQIVEKIEVAADEFWWKVKTNVGGTDLEGFVANRFLIPVKITSVILSLSGSVGDAGKNRSEDVLTVKTKLADLGFPVNRDSVVNLETISIIRLFQSIIQGAVIITGDGRVDVDGPTHKFLQAKNAPQWTEMPKGSAAEGFINHDERQDDNHDYGTNWMIETIQAAAQIYLSDYLATHPGAAVIQTNNLSKRGGGVAPPHRTHQTGLSCDIRVPRTDGEAGTTISSSDYDQDAMRAMLTAIRAQSKYKIKRIFFNDLALISEGLCLHIPGHDNHAHIDISPLQTFRS